MTSNGHSHGATQKNEAEGRWKGIVRPYTPKDVEKISGTVQIEYTLARLGAERFWKLIENEKYIQALGALTGNQVTHFFPQCDNSGGATSSGRTKGNLRFRMASCCRCKLFQPNVFSTKVVTDD